MEICVSLWRSVEDDMAGILGFMGRNMRIAIAVAVVAAAVGGAGAIGWLTAPI
jgi:hypothetical protein